MEEIIEKSIVDPEEKILYVSSGIDAYNAVNRNLNPVTLKSNNPSNTATLTEKHLVFAYIPMPFGDNVFFDSPLIYAFPALSLFNPRFYENFFFRRAIKGRLTNLLKEKNLQEVVAMDKRNSSILISDLQFINFNKFTSQMEFGTKSAYTCQYVVPNKDLMWLLNYFKSNYPSIVQEQ